MMERKRPMHPQLFDGALSLEARVRAAFAANGPLASASAHFRRREGQIEFAAEVAKVLEAKRTLIAEAGTGTGKTFAYLTPALLSGATVIISTAGKSLQDQLFQKDIPQLSKALGINVPVALLKGRANYVCHWRLERVREDGWFPEKDSFKRFREIERFAAVSATGDRSELPFVPEDDPLWPMVTSTRETCLGSEKCPYYKDCFVRAAREKAMASQIVVVNHHLFLSSIAVKQEAQGKIDGLLPKADLTVIDEAHQLPVVATDFFGTSFSTHQILEIADKARSLGRGYVPDGADWEAVYQAVLKPVFDLRLEAVALGIKEGDRRAVKQIERFDALEGPMRDAHAGFSQLMKALRANEGRNDELDLLLAYADEVIHEFESWLPVVSAYAKAAQDEAEPPADPKRMVRWLSMSGTSVRFNTTPLSFALQFRDMREKEGGAWVFTSATLSAGGDFRHFENEVGLEDATAKSWPSPFNYWEQGCFYLPAMPLPENNPKAHAERMVDAAWPLLNAAGGRTFFLCTSLAAVAAAADRLRERLEANGNPYPLLVQGEMPKAALIEEFRRLGNAVLVGSMSFWEGVDVRGDALSLVVIDKLPFSPPDDPIFSARADYIRAAGGNPFITHSLPEAIIALKQGAGRLIRSETDRGVFMLCDARVAEKFYGRKVLSSLPDFYKTRRLEKAMQFFLNPEAWREGLYC